MTNIVIHYTCPDTQSELTIESGNLQLILGADRESKSNAEAELEWLVTRINNLTQRFPDKQWGLLVSLKKVKVEQKDYVLWEELFKLIFNNNKIKAVAVLEAARTFQMVIRKTMIKNTKETG
ncbi:hypothetical protein KKG41_02590, partial [Patescibacteria group bacterium]|nr:hypothetical protein [Patescibacteria group bacterium]MBU1890867.1 hypothetical protein [Patescibacteria group bacterium]